MCQDWIDFSISSKKKTERNYSFLGLYRKFSEADVHDLIDIATKKQKLEREIDISTLFTSIYGNSVFTIFFENLNIL